MVIKIEKHEKEVLQAQLDNEKAVLKELEEVYKKALQDIDEKIAALLGRADADLPHVIYQVEYQRQLRTQIQAALEQLQAKEFETISSYLTDCYEDGFMSALYSMQQQGVPLIFPIDQSQVVAAIQTDSKISEGLYTRLGKDVGELKKTISSEVARGIATSMSYSQIAKNINRAADIGLHRAMRITRTEGGRIQNKAAMDAMYKARDNGADVMKKWSAFLDARTRPSHLRVDGEIRELEKPFSNKLMYPKDPSGGASEVCNCRCRIEQKARWALEADETRMLGDTSQMSEAQRKAIAKKLRIPEKDLDKYSKQIVPVNAKSYADFKKKYNELWHYEGSDLQKQAEARIASYKNKSAKKTIENSAKSGKIKADKMVSGHSATPKKADANSVIDHVDENNKVDTRSFYGDDGFKKIDLHTNDHGNPKMHDYGKNGEHAHDYDWNEDGSLKNKTTRNISDEEKERNGDILE